jgi:transcriptional regulator GlxA family with amidase domain
MKDTHQVTMLAYPDCQILDVTGPLEVFARTSRWLADHGQTHAREAYRVEIVADRAGPVRCSNGLELVAARSWRDVQHTGTLLVAGGIGYTAPATQTELLNWLRYMRGSSERLASICTGALVLAAAGLLDRHRATTHWAYEEQLKSAGRDIRVDTNALYVADDGIYTSAGVTAGMDLALAMMDADWSREAALAVARELVMYVKRAGGQAQFSRPLQAQLAESDRLRRLQPWMLEHLDGDLGVERLAARSAMSPRNFRRRFRLEMGMSPAHYVEEIRVEAARDRLETTRLPMGRIATLCGFGSAETMRRVFSRRLGIAPTEYRRRFAAPL